MNITVAKHVFQIDDEDAGLLIGWYKSVSAGYLILRRRATAMKKGERARFARLCMNAPNGMEVDHINHDTHDNRKSNLRICTRSENRRNSRKSNTSLSPFKGVSLYAFRYNTGAPRKKPWRAHMRVVGKRIWFGYYASAVEAAEAYNRNAVKLFGAFACLNKIEQCPVVSRADTLSACRAGCMREPAPLVTPRGGAYD